MRCFEILNSGQEFFGKRLAKQLLYQQVTFCPDEKHDRAHCVHFESVLEPSRARRQRVEIRHVEHDDHRYKENIPVIHCLKGR